MKNNLKKFFSIFLASVMLSMSSVVYGLPDKMRPFIDNYIERYDENLDIGLENNLVSTLWNSCIEQSGDPQEKLNALEDFCNVMSEQFMGCDDPKRQRLGRILLYIKQNSNYELVTAKLQKTLDLEYTSSYLLLLKYPEKGISYMAYLLYFIRTGQNECRSPFADAPNYMDRILIYNMFQGDIKYINEQQFET